MPEKMSGLNPERPMSTADDNQWKNAPERELANLLCGFGDPAVYSKYGPEPLRYSTHYLPAALDLADLKTKDGRRIEAGGTAVKRMLDIVWMDLAKILLKIAEELPGPGPEPVERVENQGFVVNRPEISRAIRNAIEYNERPLVWVFGPPGAGKTVAVNAALGRIDDFVVEIDCAANGNPFDDRTVHGHIRKALELFGEPSDGDPELVRHRFIQLLCRDGGPRYVKIENHEAGTFPEIAEDHRFQSHIIVLSRNRPPSHLADEDSIHVGDLSRDESAIVIRQFIPEAADSECEQLAAATFHRILILVQACRTISSSRGRFCIADYLDQIAHPSDFIRLVESQSGDNRRGFVSHYQFMIEALPRLNSHALSFLDLLIDLHGVHEIGFLKILWSDMYPMVRKHKGISGSFAASNEVESAWKCLHRHALIEITKSADENVETDSYEISVHPLTRLCLLELRKPSLIAGRRRFFSALKLRLQCELWKPGHALSKHMISVAWASMDLLLRKAPQEEVQGIPTDDIQLAVAVLARALRQIDVVFSNLSSRCFDYLIWSLSIDERRLIVVQPNEVLTLRPANPGDLPIEIRDASAESKQGCTAVLTELLIRLEIGTGDRWTIEGITAPCRQLNVLVPSLSRRGVLNACLDLGFHEYLTGNDLASGRESLLFVSNPSMPVMNHEDRMSLLIYGRFMASIGNISAAVTILSMNARIDVSHIIDTAGWWIVLESMRTLSDILLRAGRIVESSVVYKEILEISKGWDSRDDPPHDMVFQFRMHLLTHDISASESFQSLAADGVDEHLEMMTYYTEYCYRLLMECQLCGDGELILEVVDQLARFFFCVAIKFGAVDVRFDVTSIRSIFAESPLIESFEHRMIFDFPWTVFEVYKALKDPDLSRRSDLAETLNEFAEILIFSDAHWYAIARYRVLVACLVIGSESAVDILKVEHALDIAASCGREDWGDVIRGVCADPKKIVGLLYK
ncbi:hypothetical protein [Nocardia sp. CA-119907]|uniref:hypothetical protein n=1 Tax=Nocardia sp. CA-119907 TaxID=3239973 RepID=UPI003D973A2A